MVGSSIVRLLQDNGFCNIVTRSRTELDLCDQQAVRRFMEIECPEYVVIAAAKVGGIHANNVYPANFIYENLMIESNLIHESYKSGVKNLLFLGSSCIYPKLASQPMKETELLCGALESTNEPYAIAKIAGIKLCESYNRQYGTDYRSVMPTNLYGVQDNFHPENSHVIPALIRRFHEAKLDTCDEVIVWGSGRAKREFLYVDDLANACVHVIGLPKDEYDSVTAPMLSHINVGVGADVTILELANTIKNVVGFEGKISFDSSKPDGAPRKLLNIERLANLGWQPKIELKQGLEITYDWFLKNEGQIRL